LSLPTLSFPTLTATRARVLDAVVRLAGSDPRIAREVLGLSERQDSERVRDAELLTAHCAPAAAVYTGVLYDALGLSTLPSPAKRRATASLLISSALFGTLRIRDRIPAYRLSGAASLPGLGPVGAIWRSALPEAMTAAAGRGLVVDLRSSTYAAMWHPTEDLAARTVTVRVLQQLPDGRRQVVSHFNKATKGRLVRSLLVDGSAPRDAPAFAALCQSYGYVAELHPPERGGPWHLDVVVTEV
jgi:hypothetical protein